MRPNGHNAINIAMPRNSVRAGLVEGAAADGMAGARRCAADRSRGGGGARVHPPTAVGDVAWREETARQLGREASLRPRERPRNRAADPPSLFDPLSVQE